MPVAEVVFGDELGVDVSPANEIRNSTQCGKERRRFIFRQTKLSGQAAEDGEDVGRSPFSFSGLVSSPADTSWWPTCGIPFPGLCSGSSKLDLPVEEAQRLLIDLESEDFRPKQRFWDGKFLRPRSLEEAFCTFRFLMVCQTIRLTLVVAALVLTCFGLLLVLLDTQLGYKYFRSSPCIHWMGPIILAVIYTTTFISFTRLFTPHTYQYCLSIMALGVTFAFALPLLLSPYCRSGVDKLSNSTVLSEHISVAQDAARTSVWFIAQTDVVLIVLYCGLPCDVLPTNAVAIVFAFLISRARATMWEIEYGEPQQWSFLAHVAPICALSSVHYIQSFSSRREFVGRVFAAVAREKKVEQLQREKERLSWDMTLNQKADHSCGLFDMCDHKCSENLCGSDPRSRSIDNTASTPAGQVRVIKATSSKASSLSKSKLSVCSSAWRARSLTASGIMSGRGCIPGPKMSEAGTSSAGDG
eukprot:CAMPEP_0119316176 /NCGR_PEP_ID=MMETSP1333-20130426/38823_1 /TAXON_ID=418940 /ORGANISM="Scyphosphaera apsteinii, Strain RCC1455" /LENGTH=470 /DNA_ID=CAMNT_0007321753 /DNA_START=35 /DNA_END=1447 /DNA_ORIENTATION=+